MKRIVETWYNDRAYLLDNLMADLLPDENNLKYIVGEQHYVIQAVIALRENFLFSGKKNPPLKMNECNVFHHYKCNGGKLYFQFNFLKSQNIYLNFNISQKYPSFLTYFWKVGLGLGCICQKVCHQIIEQVLDTQETPVPYYVILILIIPIQSSIKLAN